ncbi:MAG: Mitochondrial beta-keto-acyl synthase [Phylliscum demangeonii]|nr:MAG: Mitochondrial beta-keto-acyl synthase [Phylliscum demangeonii]
MTHHRDAPSAGHCGVVTVENRFRNHPTLPHPIAAVVPGGGKEDGGWNAADWVNAGDERRMATFSQYALAATAEALVDAGWMPGDEEGKEATGICLGSGIGSLDEAYDNSVAYEKGGPNHAVSTACTTGAHAIGDASRFIAFGDADVMVAGGAESCIHPLAIAGFARARCLATAFHDRPHLASRPFDRDRTGFVMGEGAGVVILEELEHAKARGARIYAELSGYGASGDAYHMTTPLESGQGAFLSMKRALKGAGVSPGMVDYVNAHATSTVLGDAAENVAVKKLFLGSEGKPKPSDINVSSVKGAIGHLLGAAGAVEAIFTVLAVNEAAREK